MNLVISKGSELNLGVLEFPSRARARVLVSKYKEKQNDSSIIERFGTPYRTIRVVSCYCVCLMVLSRNQWKGFRLICGSVEGTHIYPWEG